MAAIFQTFSYAFSWMEMNDIRLQFHWTFVPKVPINNIPALVQIMAWRLPGDKPLSEPIMVVLPTHIYIYAALSLNELNVITHPCLNFNGSLAKLPLSLGMKK